MARSKSILIDLFGRRRFREMLVYDGDKVYRVPVSNTKHILCDGRAHNFLVWCSKVCIVGAGRGSRCMDWEEFIDLVKTIAGDE